MRIGLRKSPHIETLVEGIRRSGDTFTSTNDTGADFYLCWGWPQAQDVVRENGGRSNDVICIDAHPFALRAGERSGERIFQLGNWGRLAKYPPSQLEGAWPAIRPCGIPGGPVLVLGHVSSTEQLRQGLVDVWYTPGGDAWCNAELMKPNRKYRPHPRMWPELYPGVKQATLEEDLCGCSRAIAWNSTAVLHARMMGYPAESVEPHGWGFFTLEELNGLRVSPQQIRSAQYWNEVYRPWLLSLKGEMTMLEKLKAKLRS
jgi:hypothetical protein